MSNTPSPMSAPESIAPDMGPLAWVIGELRSSLAHARSELEAYVSARALTGANTPQAQNALSSAQRALHEAAGVLDMVGEPMAARHLRAAEGLMVSELQAVDHRIDRDVAQTIDRALHALLAYLESRLQGQGISPVVLFAHYREVQGMAGAERIHPADLWPAPSLRQTVLPPADVHPFEPDDSLRRLFDRFVLLVLQTGNPQAARQLGLLSAGLARGAPDLHTGSFWMVAGGFCEALAESLLAVDLHVKRALSRLLQQFIAISHGHPDVSEVLWRDLLFFCAQAQPAPEHNVKLLAAVRGAYQLGFHQPVDYQRVMTAQGDPLKRDQLRSALHEAKKYWELFASGHLEGGSDLLAAFARLVTALVPLQPEGSRLAERLAEAVQLAVAQPAEQVPALALDVATSLLCIEAVFAGAHVADGELAQRFAQLEQRLAARMAGQDVEPAAPWMESLYRQADESGTLGSVVVELKSSLADTEQQIEAFLRNTDAGHSLAGALDRLGQMRGVMGLLGLESAQRALVSMKGLIERLEHTEPSDFEREDVLHKLSLNVGGLSFLVDTLQHQPTRARDLFVFDESTDCLRHRDLLPTTASDEAEEPEVNLLQEQVQRVVDAVDAGADVHTLRGQLDVLAEQAALADHPTVAQAARDASHAVAQDAESGAQAIIHLSDVLPSQKAALEPEASAIGEEQDLARVFLDEARELLALAQSAWDELQSTPDDMVALTRLRRAFHTLKGSARMVGLGGYGDAAWAVERTLNDALATPEPAARGLLDWVQDAKVQLLAWLDTMTAADTPSHADHAPCDFEGSAQAWLLQRVWQPLVVAQQVDEPTLPSEEPEPPMADEAPELAQPSEPEALLPIPDDDLRQIGPVRVSTRLYNVFLNEADTWSRQLQQALEEWALQPTQPVPAEAAGFAHSLAGSSATLGFEALADVARRMESTLDRVALTQWSGQSLPPDTTACLCGSAQEVRQLLQQFAAGVYKESQAEWLARLDVLQSDLLRHSVRSEQASTVSVGPLQDDELQDQPDEALFPLFEAEAQELMPRLMSAVRQWMARLDNQSAAGEVQRVLHTLKGSARLAGVLQWGERVHELESQVQRVASQATAADLQWLQHEADALLQHLQQLSPATDVLVGVAPSVPEEYLAPVPEPTPPDLPVAGAPQGLVLPLHPVAQGVRSARATIRVATDLLDRLVNETGEVMISRVRVQGELAAVRGSLSDLSANLERLRLQLRDMELQTETQMQSRLALARDTQQAFDPLEFDRFTRVQEITRSMAESVNDVATVQRQLQRAMDGAEDQLEAQGRQSRALQRDLLSTRLVEFEAMAERLYRVVRQAAKESGKSVRLDISGGAIEMDRGVLERLTPAFEHVLRNAVVHGVESPEARQLAGKPAEGCIAIELTQVGNDVRMAVSDDGAGLDVQALGARAVALGVSLPDATDAAAWAELVFVPGLSTAPELSALAGRGVGMDVVRSDITSLGGRVQIQSTDQQGCLVEMVLPLTTAITQVVVMRAGDHVFGVPATLVDIVRRLDAPTLEQAYAQARVSEQGVPVELFWAGALLQQSPAPQLVQARGNTCVFLRSAGQRVALHVDEVLGSQEVVVKKLGTQLSGVPGLAGMSILGSGAVALIHNPVVLARLHGEAARRFAREALAAPSAAAAEATPVVSRQPLVLVVDDSITVRRVTQRLLSREGYRVALAADGLQALEQLHNETPAVVLCDIEMPRMDGFDLVRNLRADARWVDIPVIMITSRIADKHRELAMSLGANHYLGKPYPEDELMGLLHRYTRSAN
jgi:chemosensory pili system protein ChpA (sensor histidine kinase/response regulator)